MTLSIEEKAIVYGAHSHGGIVFGGFVRDMLRGDKPHDIDIFFRSRYDRKQFVSYIKGQFRGVQIRIIDDDLIEMYGVLDGFAMDRIVSTDPTFPVAHIDALVSQFPFPEGELDANVNMLMWSRDNISQYNPPYKFYMPEFGRTMDMIEKKEFVKLDTCTKHRLEKLLKKGWREVR